MPPQDEKSQDIPNGGGSLPAAGQLLSGVLAKSASHSGTGEPETLTEHSRKTRDAALAVARRIGAPGLLSRYPMFWGWAVASALLHDAGKVAAGFQLQLRQRLHPWGERHEVLSLAYVDLLTLSLPDEDRAMIAAGVVFHHHCLNGRGGLQERYPLNVKDWEKAFRVNPDAPAGYRAQVPPERHAALLAWLAAELGIPVSVPGTDLKLWQRAREQFTAVGARWSDPAVTEAQGLVAVLLQGAVTLADHSASAGVELDTETPLPFGYLKKQVARPYQHQAAAAETDGHLILIAATGSGKTEAGLAWASRQLESMPGEPRVAWVLPYRASINAMRDRFAAEFGCAADGIGLLHATAAAALLNMITCDDQAGKEEARKARAMAGAMRLFRQRLRIATPHQLLRAAIAGPKYSGVLLEQANSLFVLDELHAYDPETFGRICAAMTLWEKLGSRVAVVSATLAPPMIEMITESLPAGVTVRRAAPGTAPVRHRLVLDDQPLTAPDSLNRVRDWLADGRSVLVVANKVRTAQQVFQGLAAAADAGSLLLHSRFKYRDRKAIEDQIMLRHPQREPGQPARRGGGLVVSTQALEVSLCLDFDCGVSEIAPVEAVAQRAGRVNRRGLHPDGPVEFRVHPAESPRPYDEGAIEAAMAALQSWDGKLISEQAVNEWLACAYDTPWGRAWAQAARESRDGFAKAFLSFREPFSDRTEFADRLDEQFDSVEVLLHEDRDDYRELATGTDGDPLNAVMLLIPVTCRQAGILGARFDPRLGVRVADRRWDASYSAQTGLDLSSGNDHPVADTIL